MFCTRRILRRRFDLSLAHLTARASGIDNHWRAGRRFYGRYDPIKYNQPYQINKCALRASTYTTVAAHGGREGGSPTLFLGFSRCDSRILRRLVREGDKTSTLLTPDRFPVVAHACIIAHRYFVSCKSEGQALRTACGLYLSCLHIRYVVCSV